MARLAPPDPPLGDDVIALRRWERSDAAALVEICQDPEIPRWTLAPTPYGRTDAHRFLAFVDDGWATGARATLAIVDASDGRLLGNAGLQAIDWDRRAADVGYMLAAPARGRGVATRAVGLLVRRPECEHLDDVPFARLRDAEPAGG